MTTAIILSAGSGKRMHSDVKKQYMMLGDHPVIYYSLRAFQESFADEIVLVVSPGDEDYCRSEIVEKYSFDKVKKIVPGGKERYDSVQAGLKASSDSDYIFIHDGARPFITGEVLDRCLDEVKKYDAVVAAVPSKDTVKLVDEDGFIKETLNRDYLWNMQTPQVFKGSLIKNCYDKLLQSADELIDKGVAITDDTMAVEYFSDVKVRPVMGSYDNIKITTPEDLTLGEVILKEINKKSVEKVRKNMIKPLEECYKILEFSEYGDERGSLVIAEGNMDVPFEIKRVFYMYGSDPDVIRGQHANKESEFVLINVSGSSKVKIDNGRENVIVELNKPRMGLYLSTMIWKDMYDFSPDSVLLVLASTHYDGSEYIRDYNEYLRIIGANYRLR